MRLRAASFRGDVFVVVPLLKASVKGRPGVVFDATNVCIRSHGLEPANDVQRRGNPLWLPSRWAAPWARIRAPTQGRPYDQDDATDVVGHNDERISLNLRELRR